MAKRPLENQEAEARLAKRLRPSDPNRLTDTTPDREMDQGDANEDANPKPCYYETPFIYAFPTTLAVAKDTLFFEYDCTPWLVEPLHDLCLLWRIIDFASPYRREGDTATPSVCIGTSSEVHFYAVFPHLETIGKTAECRIFKKWHDDVMVPAFRETLRASDHAYREEYPPAHNFAVMNSEVEREEWNRPDAPLMPIITRVRQRNVTALWDAVVRRTKQQGFEEYGDVFVAAVFDYHAVTDGGITVGLTSGETHEESLNKAMWFWQRAVDMWYVPKGNMEYRVESTWPV